MNNEEYKKLDDVFKGEIDKIFINNPPRTGKSLNSFDNKDVKEYVVRYQTVITANDFWDAVDKSKEYTDLELFEVKEIFLKGDADE